MNKSYYEQCIKHKLMVPLHNDLMKWLHVCKSSQIINLSFPYSLLISCALNIITLITILSTIAYPRSSYYPSEQPTKHIACFINFYYLLNIMHGCTLSSVQTCVDLSMYD